MERTDLLIILSPPRSFSSVVSTVLGEHPQLYGFPELHLFVGDTVQEVIDLENQKAKRLMGSPGVLRTLAELHDGIQTTNSILKAAAWISERKDWTTKNLQDYLLEKIKPKIGVEKSPPTCSKPGYMERAYSYYPNAHYLHLTRHPLSARASMKQFSEELQELRRSKRTPLIKDHLVAWYQIHRNIINFTNSLPAGQTIRVKGEDILSEPDVFLPQLCEWLCIRTDKKAIDAMKHPETSPYACIGPFLAYGGNDPKFMKSPHLRHGRVREPSLSDFFAKEKLELFSEEIEDLIEPNGLRVIGDKDIKEKITHLAGVMGYQ